MERRSCMAVIQQMLDIIPYGADNEFVKDLKWNLEDASYKPPEQNDQWDRTSQTLQNLTDLTEPHRPYRTSQTLQKHILTLSIIGSLKSCLYSLPSP